MRSSLDSFQQENLINPLVALSSKSIAEYRNSKFRLQSEIWAWFVFETNILKVLDETFDTAQEMSTKNHARTVHRMRVPRRESTLAPPVEVLIWLELVIFKGQDPAAESLVHGKTSSTQQRLH